MEKYPDTRLTNQKVNKNNDPNPQSPEPEVEECCEENQIKDILKNLGLDYERILGLKSVSYVNSSGECVHCKLMEKIKYLKEGIEKLNGEIETTEKILNVKKNKNKDIRGIVEKLESVGNSDDLSEGKNCSCKGCFII